MTWDDVKPWIAKVAPMLGTALGGPLGGAAGALLSSALGPKATDPDAVAQMIKTGSITPEQILALKQADQQFQLQLKQMDINSVKDLEALAVQDRTSARQMNMTTHSKTPDILVFVALTVWFILNGFLMVMAWNNKTFPPELATLIGRVLGTMDTLLGAAFMFFYGTTSGSRTKDQLLYNSTPTKE